MGIAKRCFALCAIAGLALAFGLGVPGQSATVKKKESCAVVAKRYADREARKRVAKTALMGGTTAIFIGAIMSEFNKDGREMANGAFGGGQLGGKGAKLRRQQDTAHAVAACRAGRKI